MSNLQDQLDAEFAPAWRPAPGEKVVGTVVALDTRDGAFGRYPIVTLNTGGEEVALHAFHEVLANELARLAPKIGDELGVKYLGQHTEKGYHQYRVRRAGGSGGFAWGEFGTPDEGEGATQMALEAERDERDAALSDAEAARLAHKPLDAA
jgi:hypothetical protein